MDSDEDSSHDELDFCFVEVTHGGGGSDGDESRRNSQKKKKKHYTILEEEEIRKLQANDISVISTYFSVSRTLACTLLRRHNWSVTSLFAGEEKVLDSVARLSPPPPEQQEEGTKELLRSYVAAHGSFKFCPGPGCNRVVQIEIEDSENNEVLCDCSHAFCWNCTEEVHRPVDCKTVDKWMQLKASEAENTRWILDYTKPCPKCKTNIEKIQGGNIMTCVSPCNHKFCWLCLGPADVTHTCNKYEESRADGVRKHLMVHAHYYERWASNHRSAEKAASDLSRARNDNALPFVIQAWEQIVACRRVLKWSYAYGYYLCLERRVAKIAFFEYLQGQAEANLERLHHCAEEEMWKYGKEEYCTAGFGAFRRNLVNLTNVTSKYFEELVRALENDLSEVTDTRKKSRWDT
ncbi:hypothetical protein ABFX02_06G156900 [Erythranthe guttata]